MRPNQICEFHLVMPKENLEALSCAFQSGGFLLVRQGESSTALSSFFPICGFLQVTPTESSKVLNFVYQGFLPCLQCRHLPVFLLVLHELKTPRSQQLPVISISLWAILKGCICQSVSFLLCYVSAPH